jgi:hypothetical protein
MLAQRTTGPEFQLQEALGVVQFLRTATAMARDRRKDFYRSNHVFLP